METFTKHDYLLDPCEYIYIQRPLCVFQVVSGKSDRLIAVFLGGSFERRPSPAFVVL